MHGDNPYLVSLISSFSNLHTGMDGESERPSKRGKLWIQPGVAVSTVTVARGMDRLSGLFVLADGTLLMTTRNEIVVMAPSGLISILAGNNSVSVLGNGFRNGHGGVARFSGLEGMTVDSSGNVVVVDKYNSALRLVSTDGYVRTLAGNGEQGFADGQGAAARFKWPDSVVVTANGDYVMTDHGNHAVRVVTPGGAVRTLAGNGEAGFVDAQGAAARFKWPAGLALDVDGSILVVDSGNHAVRRVTMDGFVSTVAGNGQEGYADGEGAVARFKWPSDVVVDKEGMIVVADKDNHRLRKIVGRQVTTLAGGFEAGSADGAGTRARFNMPKRLALDECGRLLVSEDSQEDTLRVVEAGLASPAWMGPLNEAAQQRICEKSALAAQRQIWEKEIQPDVAVQVCGRRFLLHKAVLRAHSAYFKLKFQESWEKMEVNARGLHQIELDLDGSVYFLHEAFDMLTRYMYYGDSTVLTRKDADFRTAVGHLVHYLLVESLVPFFVAEEPAEEPAEQDAPAGA